MPHRAIVFDFDGVLVDSEPAHGRGLAVAAAMLGMEIREPNPRWYVGLGDTECFERIAASHGRSLDAGQLAMLIRSKAEAFSTASREGFIRLYPGAEKLVQAAALVGPVALCSGSHARDIHPLLHSLGIAECFRTVVTADDVARNKPHPDGYLLAAERLDVDPSDCITIEDSPAGIAAARAAGYRVVAVCHSFPADRLAEAHEIRETIGAAAPLVLG